MRRFDAVPLQCVLLFPVLPLDASIEKKPFSWFFLWRIMNRDGGAEF